MMDDQPGSITKDLDGLRRGDESATSRVVKKYGARLRGLVRPRVRWYGRTAASADEDDVANDALNSLIARLRCGQYPGVVEREGFWRLLARFAVWKAGRLASRCRVRPRTRGLSAIDGVADPRRSPSSRAGDVEEAARLLDAVRAYRPSNSERPSGDELVVLLQLMSEGHDIPEIAGRLGVARCTIYRWINLVKKIAGQEGVMRQIERSAT